MTCNGVSKRQIYFKTVSLTEALFKWKEFFLKLDKTEQEFIPVIDSLDRVTSKAIFARINSPSFNVSAMDGYAVKFQDTFGASERNPLKLKLMQQAIPVNTGDPLPMGFNAVIMIEDVHQIDKYIIINKPVTPYQNVRTIGEDIVQTELIIPENHKIRPVDIGAILSSGHTHIWVRKKPMLCIIPTGDEVINPGEDIKKGSVVDFNSFMLGAMMLKWGGEYERQDIVPDSMEKLKKAIIKCLDHCDILAIIAGSAVGTKDFTPEIIKEMGKVIVHGVSIKPGKPILLGNIKEKPVIGVPGYPVSAYITFELFCKPLVFHLLGLEPEIPPKIKAKISRPVTSVLGQDEFLRVKIGKVKDTFVATPVGRGAGALMTLQRADGIINIPKESEGIASSSEVEVTLLKSVKEIENNIVCIGSHDNALDILANYLHSKFPCYSLSSANIGSMGGIMAIKRGETHISGIHLLDEITGEYNIPFIKRFLNGIPLKLINFVYRQQGFIVKKGNPKCIKGIEDLTRKDIIFINRQRGAGTRLLIDKLLKEKGIFPEQIKGYEREEYTHIGVASKVASGSADVGMGILAAALALGLDFIPVAKERYDLIIPQWAFNLNSVKSLLDIINNDINFRNSVQALGGYDVSNMGKVIYNSI